MWNKKSEKTKEHVGSAYHHKCMELADNFKHTVEHPETTITAWHDAHIVANIKRNQSIQNPWLVQYYFVVGSALLHEEILRKWMHLRTLETF